MEPLLFNYRRWTGVAWLLLAAACCGLPDVIRADDTSKAVLINELFEVRHSDTLMQQIAQQALMAQRARLEKVEPFKSNKAASDELLQRLGQLLADKLTWEKLKPAMTKLYANNFTVEELSAILAFYKTPAGQAMLTKLPKILVESMVVGQQAAGDLAPDVRQITRDVMAKYPTPRSSPAHDWPNVPDISSLQ